MKRVLLLALVVTSAAVFAADVHIDLQYLNISPATNRWVQLQAKTPFVGDFINYTSSVSGGFWVSNLAGPGDWEFVVKQRGTSPERRAQFSLESGASGIYHFSNITSVVGIQTWPQSARAAWSIPAADARYAFKGSVAGLDYTPQPGSANLTNWSTLSTNVLSSLGGGTSGALTNDDSREVVFPQELTLGNGLSVTGGVVQLPTLVRDASTETGWVQQQADGTLQQSSDGGSLTNLAAASLTGTISDDRLPATITSDITGNAATAGIATNSLVGEPLAGMSGTNAYASFSHNNGTIHATTTGWHNNYLTALTNLQITAVAFFNQGNHTNVVTVGVLDAYNNVLGRGVGRVPLGTIGPHYIKLDAPVVIPRGTVFKPGINQRYQAGHFYAVSTPTLQAGASAHFTHVGAAGPSTSVYDGYFSGWAGLGFDVNFLYNVLPDSDTQVAFGATVTAPEYAGGLIGSYGNQAVSDLGEFADPRYRAPYMAVSTFVHDYDADRLINQSNVWQYSYTIRTQGLKGVISVDINDLWFLGVNDTNRTQVHTLMSHFPWTANAGGSAGANVRPTYLPRVNGFLMWNTNTFPGGPSNLVFVCRTNNVDVQFYHNSRTNLAWFSNDVWQASVAGFSTMMLDTTVNGVWHGVSTTPRHMRELIRTYHDAVLAAGHEANLNVHQNRNRYMLLHAGAQANQGTGNDVTNNFIIGDMLHGVTGMYASGEDVNTLASTVNKARKVMALSKWTRPWHYFDYQYMGWSASQTPDYYRRKLNITAMLPVVVRVNPDALFRPADELWPLKSSGFTNILCDAGVIPGREILTNTSGFGFVWQRPLGSYTSGSNAICFINLSNNTDTVTLNVTNFGGVSNAVYVMKCPWFETNWFFINQTTRTVTATNSEMFVCYPARTDSVLLSPGALRSTDTSGDQGGIGHYSLNSASANPHYFTVGAYNGASGTEQLCWSLGVEPDVAYVRVEYKWVGMQGTATNGWTDRIRVDYNTDIYGRIIGSNDDLGVTVTNQYVHSFNRLLTMPNTNAWKTVNYQALLTTSNAMLRIQPYGVLVTKYRP